MTVATLQLTIPDHGAADFRFGDGVVTGYVWREGKVLRCPWMASARPGNGDGGRCIAALEQTAKDAGLRLVFCNLISGRLQDMLQRRGYTERYEMSDMGLVDVWEKGGGAP